MNTENNLVYTKHMSELNELVKKAGITAEEPTFDDFMEKASDCMYKASNEGYYAAVMLDEMPDNDPDKLCQSELDKAIEILQLAKRFTQLTGL